MKNIPEFSSETFFQKKILNSKDIFNKNKFYLFNIWASWCVPCVDEHPLLIDLGKSEKIEIVGLNYKDHLIIDQKLIRPSEVDTLLADCSKAKKNLKWEPKISFDDLVKGMVENDMENSH